MLCPVCFYASELTTCLQNLGLGVLEERRSDDDASSSSDESNSDSSGEQDRPSRESNVLGRLMGKESTSKPTIEEVTQ